MTTTEPLVTHDESIREITTAALLARQSADPLLIENLPRPLARRLHSARGTRRHLRAIGDGRAWLRVSAVAGKAELRLELVDLAPGQKAEIVFDAAPGKTFTGSVEAIGAGTGAEFSLLPAQNATGNWVKVTQRVPVRLELDEAPDLSGIGSGVSASVAVDTGKSRGLGDIFSAFAG